jgi:DNA-binding NarL/FixJ family response regulator
MDLRTRQRMPLPTDRSAGWAGGRETLNVLIVSGDPGVRKAGERILRQRGYAVTCAAHSGHALLACLRGARIDLAVVDATLEDMPGSELAERLRRRVPALHILFLAQAGTPAAPGIVVRPLTDGNLIAELDAAVTSPTAS